MTPDEQLMWGSHLPMLAACVAATSGDVLELGVGDFSTPVLHALCGATGRNLVSVEDDMAWCHKLALRFTTQDWHKFYNNPYDDFHRGFPNRNWSVALIDNSPGGERRAKDFILLLPRTEWVVVHDYWQDNEEHIAPLLKGINFVVSSRQNPPTLVASAIHSVFPRLLYSL